jgi:hypothetical protein
MEDHTRIEDTILVPVISKMEQEILKNWMWGYCGRNKNNISRKIIYN